MFISLVVNDPHVTALTVVKDDAVAAPSTIADDALRGLHTTSPCNVVFVRLRVIRSEAFNWI